MLPANQVAGSRTAAFTVPAELQVRPNSFPEFFRSASEGEKFGAADVRGQSTAASAALRSLQRVRGSLAGERLYDPRQCSETVRPRSPASSLDGHRQPGAWD